MRSTLVGLACFVLVFGEPATQAADGPDDTPQADRVYAESLEVEIANIDVTVTGPDGLPVRGLSRDDFTLFENGVAQPIANFYAVEPSLPSQQTEPTAPPSGEGFTRRNVVVVFVDSYSLHPFRRNEVLRSVQSVLERTWRKNDVGLLAVFDRSLRIPVLFTTDVTGIVNGIDQIFRASASGLLRDEAIRKVRIRQFADEAAESNGPVQARAAYSRALSEAQAWSEELRGRTRDLAEAATRVCDLAAGMEGRKAMLFVGGSFPRQPGLELYQYVNNVFAIFGAQLKMVEPALAAESTLGRVSDELVATANADAIAFYAIYLKPEGDMDDGNRPSDQIEDFLKFTNNAETLLRVSNESGGRALLAGRDFDRLLNGLSTDLTTYYSLGYRLLPGASRRQIHVQTKNRSYVVRARSSVLSKSVDVQSENKVLSTLFSASGPREMLLSARLKQKGRRRVTYQISASLPSSIVSLLPQSDGSQAGGLDFVIAVRNSRNDSSDIQRLRREVSFASAPPERITVEFELIVRNEAATAAIGAFDRISRESVLAMVDLNGN